MKLEGPLEAFGLPDLFQLLTATRKSGGLHLHRGAQRGVIRLVDGAISGASSDTTRQSLVRRLVGAGQLTEESLSAGVARVRGDRSVGLARAMQEAGAVDDTLLLDVAREQTVDALFDVLRWTDGTFTFEVDEADGDDLGLRQSADELVAAAGQRIAAWPALSGQISSPDVVLRLTPAPEHDPTLTRDEWALVALIDGRRDIRDLVDLCGRGEFATVALLGPLVERGLLEVPGEGAGDDVATGLLRRQHLIESLEGTSEPVESGPATAVADLPPVDTAPVPLPRAPERTQDEPAPAPPVESHSVLPVPPEWPQEETSPPRLQGSRRGLQSGIVPAPDDDRQVVIEPDPSVNKGMLLRLIAGVRAV